MTNNSWQVIDTDLIPANIKSGVNIFGVDGSFNWGWDIPVWGTTFKVAGIWTQISSNSDYNLCSNFIHKAFETASAIYFIQWMWDTRIQSPATFNFIYGKFHIMKLNKSTGITTFFETTELWSVWTETHNFWNLNVYENWDWILKLTLETSGGAFFRSTFDTNTDIIWTNSWDSEEVFAIESIYTYPANVDMDGNTQLVKAKLFEIDNSVTAPSWSVLTNSVVWSGDTYSCWMWRQYEITSSSPTYNIFTFELLKS